MKALTTVDRYSFETWECRPICGPCWRIFLAKKIHAERVTRGEPRKRKCCFCFKVKREILFYLVFLSIAAFDEVRLIHEMYLAEALEREKLKPRRKK